jgi:LPPG:FO 2-phospho-L-lactate transferase
MSGHVLALSGGVGGAKLAAGLAEILPPDRLTIAVNTGDDFEHFGLTVCPDIDSVVYAMADLNDRQRGWGVADESWRMMEMLGRLGEEQWFNLGDRDLAMHIARSSRLRAGESLSEVTARLTGALGIAHAVVPMSDAPVRTQVATDDGWLDFQRYFVAEQCRPVARAIRFAGTPGAAPSPGLASALARPDLAAVIFCPSNPFLSVDPILAVDGVRDKLASLTVPRIAVSPLIGGKSLKGPLGKLLGELGRENSNRAIAEHYAGLIDRLVIDRSDVEDSPGLREASIAVTVTDTIMHSCEDQTRLARETLASAGVTVE